MRSNILIQIAFGSCVLAAPLAQKSSGHPATGKGGLDLEALFNGAGGKGGSGGSLVDLLTGLETAGGEAGLDWGKALGGGGDLGTLLSGSSGSSAGTDAIISSYTSVKGKLKAFATSLDTITASGGATTIKNALTKLKAVETALKEASTKIDATDSEDVLLTNALSSAGSELTTLLQKSTTALISKKDIIAKAKQKDAVLQQAKSLKTAVEAFTTAVIDILPTLSTNGAKTDSKKSLEAIDKVVAAFS